VWTREELKSRAKAVLATNYWKSFLISIVIVIASVNGDEVNYKINEHRASSRGFLRHAIDEITNYSLDNREFFIIIIGLVLATLAFRILIGFSLEIGGRKYFVQSAR
jgi:hypothetical protein